MNNPYKKYKQEERALEMVIPILTKWLSKAYGDKHDKDIDQDGPKNIKDLIRNRIDGECVLRKICRTESWPTDSPDVLMEVRFKLV